MYEQGIEQHDLETFGCLMTFDIEKYYDTANFGENNKSWLVFCLTMETAGKGIYITSEMRQLAVEGYRCVETQAPRM